MTTTITAKMVADLRNITSLGMMDCKKALVESNGNMEKAEEILRIKSGSKIEKLKNRDATEGIITSAFDNKTSCLVEINCETDFVAKDKIFFNFADIVTQAVLNQNPIDLDSLNQLNIDDGKTLSEMHREVVAKLGENINIRRFERFESDGSTKFITYNHNNKIGVMIEYNGINSSDIYQIAMHIAASKPQYISKDDVPPELIEKERHIYTEQVNDSGKPIDIVTKIVDGKVNKFLSNIVLLEQQFVINPEKTVGDFLKEQNLEVTRFSAFHLGDGLDKKVNNYADEVESVANSIITSKIV